MQKFKLFFVVLATILISATSFNVNAQAAQVTSFNNHRGYVWIDEGKDAGFVMGAAVCIYSFSGDIITCGRVQSTSESHATVMVNQEKAIYIKNGMEAKLNGENAGEDGVNVQRACVDDSDCGDTGYCVNGKCQGTKGW